MRVYNLSRWEGNAFILDMNNYLFYSFKFLNLDRLNPYPSYTKAVAYSYN